MSSLLSPIIGPTGVVSIIVSGPLLVAAPYNCPGFSKSSSSTMYNAEPAHGLELDAPPPIIATYLSFTGSSLSSAISEGSLTILGVDQVSPNLL